MTIGDIDQQQSGAIVSISPDASWQGEPKEAVYGGVKAAINSCMKTIARENGRYGIRCNVVCPGVSRRKKRKMWAAPACGPTPPACSLRATGKGGSALPLNTAGRPGDVPNAVSHITGQVLSVSGGYSMIG
ncbi:MAG: SDR family oxidoreductase [Pseudomonadota bacterium]